MAFKRYKHLNVPDGWERYWTKYPQGMTILESLFEWVSQVDSMVDNQNKMSANVEQFRIEIDEFVGRFDERLQDEVTQTLNEWQTSGFLDVVISEALQWQLDDYITTNEQDKLSLTAQLAQIVINVQSFGAKGDGITDDGEAIRTAYNHLKSLGGGKLYFPESAGDYLITSTVPYLNLLVGLNIDAGNISFVGGSQGVRIKAGVHMDSLVYVSVRSDYLEFDNIFLDGAKMSNYCFNTSEVYCAYMSVKNSKFYNAIEDAFHVRTFVSTFDKSIFGQSKRGLVIRGLTDNVSTAVTLNSCYALGNTDYGFYLSVVTYSTLNSCAVDNMLDGAAYFIGGRGVSLNSCGAENVKKAFETPSFRGVTINTFYGLNIGSKDELAPTNYLFEFVAGTDGTISGLHLSTTEPRYYDYKLGLTGSSYGYENITVMDGSLSRDDIFFVTNWNYSKRPIKLIRGDETIKKESVTLTVDDLPNYLYKIQGMEINHTLTIQLTDGSQSTLTSAQYIEDFKGTGKIIIQGNTTDRTKVKLHGGSDRLILNNNMCQVEFKNLTIENRVGSPYSNMFTTNNARHVILNNVGFDNTERNTGSAVASKNGSRVFITGGTSLVGTADFWKSEIQATWYSDETSEIKGV